MKNEELVHSSFWEGVTEGIMKFHFDNKGRLEGEVTEIIKRNNTELIGILSKRHGKNIVKPLDYEMLDSIGKRFKKILTIEDGVLAGGVGSAVMEFMSDNGYDVSIKRIGIKDNFVQHGSVDELYKICGLDEDSIYSSIIQLTNSLK